jgi:hypothetical protein
MNENKVKRQHIVPATYLRKFCIIDNDKYVLYAFNKQTQEIICTQPESIGKITEFYETIEEDQVLEKTFQDFEERYNDLFDKIILDISSLSEEDKVILSKFIALQFLRTERMKLSFSEIPNSLLKTDGDRMVSSLKEQIEEAIKPEHVRQTNKKFILENFDKFAEILRTRKWMLITNKTRMPYWTSDNPITSYNPLKSGGYGLTSTGVQFFFPLSSKYCLAIFDPLVYFHEPPKKDAKKENLDFQRCLQVDHSNRFIFSKEKEFLLARVRILERPELSNLNRSGLIRVN